jgi:hypothetical protein
MPALLELQRAFAGALLDEAKAGVLPAIVEDGIAAAERLRIYRNTCRATLAETLRMTYPVVERLVGPEFFAGAAQRYVAENPARSGYLNDYGAGLAGFLECFAPARPLAYLPDVARFEWALSAAANAVDAPALDAAVLLDVPAGRHAGLRFQPHPSVGALELRYPADEIADAVLAGDEAAMAQVDLESGPVRLVVHRGREGLETERVNGRAFRFLAALFAGQPLGRLAALAPEEAPALLARQLAKGRLSAFRSPP